MTVFYLIIIDLQTFERSSTISSKGSKLKNKVEFKNIRGKIGWAFFNWKIVLHSHIKTFQCQSQT